MVPETAQFLSALAWAQVRELPEELQGDARRAWSRRWNMVLGHLRKAAKVSHDSPKTPNAHT